MRTGYHKGTRKGANPYLRFLGPEDHLQHRVITWCRLNKIKFHHSPNEGRRSDFERFKYSYLGSDCGFPDLLFVQLKLAVELKIKPNGCTPDQKIWLEFFKSIGWKAEVCFTYDEAVKIIAERKEVSG